MLILSPLRIGPQRRHALSPIAIHRLRIPRSRRPIHFRSHPSLHMPSVQLRIFRLLPQLHYFSHQISALVAIFKLSADPVQPVPSPHHAIIRLAVPIHSTSDFQSFCHAYRCFMPFSSHTYHFSQPAPEQFLFLYPQIGCPTLVFRGWGLFLLFPDCVLVFLAVDCQLSTAVSFRLPTRDSRLPTVLSTRSAAPAYRYTLRFVGCPTRSETPYQSRKYTKRRFHRWPHKSETPCSH
jgi:hypothetical protein